MKIMSIWIGRKSVALLLLNIILTTFIKESSQNLWDKTHICFPESEPTGVFCLLDESTKLVIHKNDKEFFEFSLGRTKSDLSPRESPQIRRSNVFIGVAISKDQILGDDLVVYCINGNVIGSSINAAGKPSENVNLWDSMILRKLSAFSEGLLQCSFIVADIEQKLEVPETNKTLTFNFHKNIFIHLLHGSNKIGDPPITEVAMKKTTIGPLNLSKYTGEIANTSPNPLVTAVPDLTVFPVSNSGSPVGSLILTYRSSAMSLAQIVVILKLHL